MKLSALHPRYEYSQKDKCIPVLVEALTGLCVSAKEAAMGLNIDAEEADRLDLSLDVIEAVLKNEELAGWDGFGVVVQAYSKRALPVIDWLYRLTETTDRKIMVRLVKGAYWDTEIKHAQVEGLPGFPVFTRKPATDVSYIFASQRLLELRDRIYPQFATHNAHTVASILAADADPETFEFQRLHGMGEALHDLVLQQEKTRCRIYAPVGAHRDLLAYLVRRLLENGANSSFVNQIVDVDVPPQVVAADPFSALAEDKEARISRPNEIFAPRKNSQGWDLTDKMSLARIDRARAPFKEKKWAVQSLAAMPVTATAVIPLRNPSKPNESLGTVRELNADDVSVAIGAACIWDNPVTERAAILRRAADLYEENFGEFFAALAREAGKSLPDAVAELREAVDFLRYYADEAERLGDAPPRGIFACISPWNFPLAIFTRPDRRGAGGGERRSGETGGTDTCNRLAGGATIAQGWRTRLRLQLLIGPGGVVGAGLSADPRIDGVAFTGSTATENGSTGQWQPTPVPMLS